MCAVLLSLFSGFVVVTRKSYSSIFHVARMPAAASAPQCVLFVLLNWFNAMDVSAASMRAFGQNLRVGDTFRTRGGGREPVAVEYTDPPPYGTRIRALPPGTILRALDIVVAYRYLGDDVPWRDTFISIRCASMYMHGEEVWVNVSRGSTLFARPVLARRRTQPY